MQLTVHSFPPRKEPGRRALTAEITAELVGQTASTPVRSQSLQGEHWRTGPLCIGPTAYRGVSDDPMQGYRELPR